MIATGNVRARAATPMSLVKSPDKGTPGVQITFRLLDGPDKDSAIDWIGWLSEKTTGRTAEALGLMGYDGDDPTTVTRKDVVLVIEHEEYSKADGTQAKRAKVAWVNDPSGGGRMEMMSVTEAAGAKDRLRAALMAVKSKAAASVKPEDEPRF